MKHLNKAIGTLGEDLSKEYLKNNGYIILKENFSCYLGEIDIIALKAPNLLLFIEVKSRYSLKYGLPLESITYSKQQKIIKSAQYYINKHNLYNYFCSFDALEIIFNYYDDSYKLNHLKNVFYLY